MLKGLSVYVWIGMSDSHLYPVIFSLTTEEDVFAYFLNVRELECTLSEALNFHPEEYRYISVVDYRRIVRVSI